MPFLLQNVHTLSKVSLGLEVKVEVEQSDVCYTFSIVSWVLVEEAEGDKQAVAFPNRVKYHRSYHSLDKAVSGSEKTEHSQESLRYWQCRGVATCKTQKSQCFK